MKICIQLLVLLFFFNPVLGGNEDSEEKLPTLILTSDSTEVNIQSIFSEKWVLLWFFRGNW